MLKWKRGKRIYHQDTESKLCLVLNSILKQTKNVSNCLFLMCLKMNELMHCFFIEQQKGKCSSKVLIKQFFPGEKRRVNCVILCCYPVKISMTFNSPFLSKRFTVWFMIYWNSCSWEVQNILKISSEDYFYYSYVFELPFLRRLNMHKFCKNFKRKIKLDMFRVRKVRLSNSISLPNPQQVFRLAASH